MTNEPAYKFIAYAHKPMFGMNTLPSEVEYTIGSHDASRDDMLDAFKYFLMAAGYSFSLSESIQVVDEDWEDAQEEADEDNSGFAYDPYAYRRALIELLHTEIQELQNELGIDDKYLIDIYKMVEDLRGGTDAE